MNELELALTEICHCSRAQLYQRAGALVLEEEQLKALDSVLRARSRLIPIQYALGHADFMGLQFKVTRDVLIPRPETELLVEAFLEAARTNTKKSPLSVLDIGTGSGCIAITLAKELGKRAQIVASDISSEALVVARENACTHHVTGQIAFARSNLFSSLFFKKGTTKFDYIISNPPYIPTRDIGRFDPTTLKEPRIALDGGKDGCDFYRRLSQGAPAFLKKGGLMFFEFGEGQTEIISKLFSNKQWKISHIKKDYHHTDRFAIIEQQ